MCRIAHAICEFDLSTFARTLGAEPVRDNRPGFAFVSRAPDAILCVHAKFWNICSFEAARAKSHMSCREKILPGNAIFGCNWQHGCCLRFRCNYSILLFLNSLFCKTTACARLNRARFTMCLSALNTYEVRPGNKNFFFLICLQVLTMTMCIVKMNGTDHRRSSPISASEHVAQRKEKKAGWLSGWPRPWLDGWLLDWLWPTLT